LYYLVAGKGYIAHVTNQQEQDYFVRFLANHTYVQSIWLGLTDSEQEGATVEGKWTWISGITVFIHVSLQSFFNIMNKLYFNDATFVTKRFNVRQDFKSLASVRHIGLITEPLLDNYLKEVACRCFKTNFARC